MGTNQINIFVKLKHTVMGVFNWAFVIIKNNNSNFVSTILWIVNKNMIIIGNKLD